MTVDAVDCQAFAGGFTLGTVQAGLRLVGKREGTGGFGVDACEANRHLLGREWTAEASDPVDWTPVDVPYVFGNPPCSGFSVMSNSDFRGMDSPINQCMWDFWRFAAKCDPEVVVMESVGPAFTKGLPLMRRLVEDFEQRVGRSYAVTHVLQDGYSLGGCAIRRRYFLVAHRVPFGVEPVALERPLPTFWDAIADLDDVPLSFTEQAYGSSPVSRFAAPLRSPDGVVDGHDTLRYAGNLRCRALAEELGWAPGECLDDKLSQYYAKHGQAPEWLKNEKQLRRLAEVGRTKSGFNQERCWAPDRAARVIHGGACHVIMHPTQPRQITQREALRVMGFCDDWRISSLQNKNSSAMYWGKGVSVHVGRWISSWARAAVVGEPGTMTGEEMGENERLVDVSRDWRRHATVNGTPLTAEVNA